MSTVSETIPVALRPDVDAAIAWFNRDQAIPFEVTGILDPDAALASDSPRELKLVLCGGDRCEQRSFHVAPGADGREVRFLEEEPQLADDRAQAEWELGFECVGDPHQEIPETARERGWLEIFVQTRLDFLRRSAPGFEPTHPKGYFQPGVLVLSREGRVLYRWRSVPSRKNVGGAMVRLGVFAALWIAAFATLPTLPVAAVLAGWVAWIFPKVRWLNREFQNISNA